MAYADKDRTPSTGSMIPSHTGRDRNQRDSQQAFERSSFTTLASLNRDDTKDFLPVSKKTCYIIHKDPERQMFLPVSQAQAHDCGCWCSRGAWLRQPPAGTQIRIYNNQRGDLLPYLAAPG